MSARCILAQEISAISPLGYLHGSGALVTASAPVLTAAAAAAQSRKGLLGYRGIPTFRGIQIPSVCDPINPYW